MLRLMYFDSNMVLLTHILIHAVLIANVFIECAHSSNHQSVEEVIEVDNDYDDDEEQLAEHTIMIAEDQDEDELDEETEAIVKLRIAAPSAIHIDEITVSGMSTGGSFAQILHLSHSNLFSGIGIFCGAFYKCGGISSRLEELYAKCGIPGGFNTSIFAPNEELSSVKTAIESLVTYEETELIDPLENLALQKLYIWIATLDQWQPVEKVAAAVDIYQPYLESKEQIKTVLMSSTHHFPTSHIGTPCNKASREIDNPFIGHCGYNGAFEMLNFLLSRPDTGFIIKDPKRQIRLNALIEFDQTEFFTGIPELHSLDDTGFVYVPSQCQESTEHCHLHFYFHACFTSREYVDTEHIHRTGFLEIAERNGIIIVFPQIKKTKENPYTCWDSFGYTGDNFANKRGSQVRAVRRMVTAFFPKTEKHHSHLGKSHI